MTAEPPCALPPAAAEPLVVVEGLSFHRGSRAVFDSLDMTMARGEITAVLGPSGVGKTTLLKLIGGELRPDRGRVLVGGEDVHRLSRSRLYALRMRMGVLFQAGALFTDLDVHDNVAFPLREHTRLSEEMIRDVVLLKLEAVGLRNARTLRPRELSGGMARRVSRSPAPSPSTRKSFSTTSRWRARTRFPPACSRPSSASSMTRSGSPAS